MIKIKFLALTTILLTTIMSSCNNSQNNAQHLMADKDSSIKNTTTNVDTITTSTVIDSVKSLASNLKNHYPEFILKLDSSVFDFKVYSKSIYPDTEKCSSFRIRRSFLGKIENISATVKENRSSAKELFLQSGNLNLWVCNLPQKIKANDTLFITGLVYNTLGNEKSWGYPTILTKINIKN
jgi:hypothetical protein